MGFTKEEMQAMLQSVSKEFAEKVEEAQRKATEPRPGQPGTPSAPSATPPAEEKQWDPKLRIARACRYLFQAQGNKFYALEIAEKAGDHQVMKALGESSLAGGGAMVQGDFETDVVEVLRSASVIRERGVRTVPMNGGSLTMPYGATGASAGYIGENANITKTEPTLGQINFVAKKLAAVVPTSNELLSDTSGRADTFIRDDLAAAMADKENSQLIRGTAASAQPTSLQNLSTVAGTNFAANGTVSIANTVSDLGTAIRKVEEGNVRITKGGWIFDTRTKWYLMTALDSNGNYVFRDELMRGTLLTYPFSVTTAIPNNLGGGTDESEVYFANFDSLILAESDQLSLEVFPGGAYHDGSNVISGISQDQTVIRAIQRHDFNSRFRGLDVAYMSAVKWGS